MEPAQQPTIQAAQQPTTENSEDLIKEGDTVVIYMGINSMKMEKIKAKQILNVSVGCFHHDSMIGRPYGSKIISFGKGKEAYVYVLRPTPTLITETLARKTQILFSMDISAILLKLNLLPGDVVVEAGTGSGSLSCSIATAISPNGHLYTFEFNEERARLTQESFKELGFTNITSTHRDVVANGFGLETKDYEADALFLDVPNPQQAITKAKAILKSSKHSTSLDGRICCFSPCIEQVQRTCQELRKQGFHRVQTHECLNRTLQRREHYKSEKQYTYSTGPKSIRGHTGYLTFGYL